jgi:phage terminase small subunit
MGARGPQRKLAILHYLSGNPSKKSKKELEVVGLNALGEPFLPVHLGEDARHAIELIKESMPPGVYGTLDTFLLSAFGVAWAIHKRAAVEIAKSNFNWTTPSGLPSPWIKIASEQAQVMSRLGSRLGLDPIAREGMQAAATRQTSDFNGLLAGRVTYTGETN